MEVYGKEHAEGTVYDGDPIFEYFEKGLERAAERFARDLSIYLEDAGGVVVAAVYLGRASVGNCILTVPFAPLINSYLEFALDGIDEEDESDLEDLKAMAKELGQFRAELLRLVKAKERFLKRRKKIVVVTDVPLTEPDDEEK